MHEHPCHCARSTEDTLAMSGENVVNGQLRNPVIYHAPLSESGSYGLQLGYPDIPAHGSRKGLIQPGHAVSAQSALLTPS